MHAPQNHPTVDLTECDREPIHLLGAIQSFGLLVAFTSDWVVSRVSGNIASFIDRLPEDVLGSAATELIEMEALHAVRTRLQWLRPSGGTERLFKLDLFGNGARYDVAVHLSRSEIVLEAEPTDEAQRIEAISLVRTMMGRLREVGSFEDYLAQAARQVRSVTGYDRVMVYRFLADGSGEVVAESRSKRAESYMGLRYPASDIPAQARALYKANTFRIIADVAGEHSAIVPQRSPTGEPLDLSMSILRAVSPIHLEYLTNMGVRSSLSVSIVVDGELWGLFACHHLAPRKVGFDRRTAVELFADMFSLELASRNRQAAMEADREARAVHERIMSSASINGSEFENLRESLDEFRAIINADGCGVWVDGEYALAGRGLDRDEARRLVRFLNRTGASRIFASDALSREFEEALTYPERAAGILAIPVSRRPRDYLIFYRGEVAQSVTWAGNPHKLAERSSGSMRLSPRKSFEAWRDVVRNTSAPWTDAELRVAESLRVTLLELILRSIGQQNEARQKAQETQDLLIAELNHRVRNILTLIRGIVSQTGSGAQSVAEFTEVLGGRIQALARAHDQLTMDQWAAAPVRTLMENEVAGYVDERRDRVTLQGPNVSLQPQAYTSFALVFHELTTNSAKYGSLSDKRGRLTVDWTLQPDGSLVIAWTEMDGPQVTPPERRGFGTTLIERAIPFELNGEASIDYTPKGVRARFVIPERFVTAASVVAQEVRAAPVPVETLIDGGTVLLVEDNVIIAMDAEAMLLDLGFADVVLANNVAGALARLSDSAISCALLDINLGSETSIPIAEELTRKRIPFVFASGYGDVEALPSAFRDRTILTKPYLMDKVGEALSRVRGASAAN